MINFFNICYNISYWLFSSSEECGTHKGYTRIIYDKKRAINRIRKYIEYVKRKEKLMRGGTLSYELARRVEGNWNISQEVSQCVAI